MRGGRRIMDSGKRRIAGTEKSGKYAERKRERKRCAEIEKE